jgi:hypothetical protein
MMIFILNRNGKQQGLRVSADRKDIRPKQRNQNKSIPKRQANRHGYYCSHLGGFAKCYEGINLDNNNKIAIKVVEKGALNKNRAKQKVQLSRISFS